MTLEDLKWWLHSERIKLTNFMLLDGKTEYMITNNLSNPEMYFFKTGPYYTDSWKVMKELDTLSLLCHIVEFPKDKVIWWDDNIAEQISDTIPQYRKTVWDTIIEDHYRRLK